jgi:hypothetical protein
MTYPHSTRSLCQSEELAPEDDVPNWHTLRSLGGIMGDLIRDLERRSQVPD